MPAALVCVSLYALWSLPLSVCKGGGGGLGVGVGKEGGSLMINLQSFKYLLS